MAYIHLIECEVIDNDTQYSIQFTWEADLEEVVSSGAVVVRVADLVAVKEAAMVEVGAAAMVGVGEAVKEAAMVEVGVAVKEAAMVEVEEVVVNCLQY